MDRHEQASRKYLVRAIGGYNPGGLKGGDADG
jgi:hypothetical protein